MLKKWRANSKLSKFRLNHPKRNVDRNGNVIIDECHLVCFINEEFPSEHQMLALIDVTSQWFYSYGSTQTTLKWGQRRANPIVCKSPDHYELKRIVEQSGAMFSDKISTSFFAGELIAVCVGPVWNSRLDSFERFDKIVYE